MFVVLDKCSLQLIIDTRRHRPWLEKKCVNPFDTFWGFLLLKLKKLVYSSIHILPFLGYKVMVKDGKSVVLLEN